MIISYTLKSSFLPLITYYSKIISYFSSISTSITRSLMNYSISYYLKYPLFFEYSYSISSSILSHPRLFDHIRNLTILLSFAFTSTYLFSYLAFTFVFDLYLRLSSYDYLIKISFIYFICLLFHNSSFGLNLLSLVFVSIHLNLLLVLLI